MKRKIAVFYSVGLLLCAPLCGAMKDEPEKKLAEHPGCVICLEKDDAHYVILFPCGHIFHDTCISQLQRLQEKHICEKCYLRRLPCPCKCPLCRSVIKYRVQLWQYPFDREWLGKYCLLPAVEKNLLEAAKVILDYGASIFVQDSKGRKPLQIAVENGFDEMAKLLKCYGAQ